MQAYPLKGANYTRTSTFAHMDNEINKGVNDRLPGLSQKMAGVTGGRWEGGRAGFSAIKMTSLLWGEERQALSKCQHARRGELFLDQRLEHLRVISTGRKGGEAKERRKKAGGEGGRLMGLGPACRIAFPDNIYNPAEKGKKSLFHRDVPQRGGVHNNKKAKARSAGAGFFPQD